MKPLDRSDRNHFRFKNITVFSAPSVKISSMHLVGRLQVDGVRALVIIGRDDHQAALCRRHLLAVLRSLTESDLVNLLIVSVVAGSQYFIVAAARCATAHAMSTRLAATAGLNFPHFYVDFIDIRPIPTSCGLCRLSYVYALRHESIQNLNDS